MLFYTWPISFRLAVNPTDIKSPWTRKCCWFCEGENAVKSSVWFSDSVTDSLELNQVLVKSALGVTSNSKVLNIFDQKSQINHHFLLKVLKIKSPPFFQISARVPTPKPRAAAGVEPKWGLQHYLSTNWAWSLFLIVFWKEIAVWWKSLVAKIV